MFKVHVYYKTQPSFIYAFELSMANTLDFKLLNLFTVRFLVVLLFYSSSLKFQNFPTVQDWKIIH
jgi:hypothetical protein